MPPEDGIRIRVTKNGPYVVKGRVPIVRQTIVVDADGESSEWQEGDLCAEKESCLLCRCGRSGRKPFCDGSHMDTSFDGTETASRTRAEHAIELPGPVVSLSDAKPFCAEARFCHRSGGIWNLVEHTDEPDVAAKVTRQASQCPSGRYVASETETGESLEPDLEPSIGLIRDPKEEVSGPLWVRGGIPIESADGTEYEVRNRVTLCRCGRSSNKPFCDGSHIDCHFNEDH